MKPRYYILAHPSIPMGGWEKYDYEIFTTPFEGVPTEYVKHGVEYSVYGFRDEAAADMQQDAFEWIVVCAAHQIHKETGMQFTNERWASIVKAWSDRAN